MHISSGITLYFSYFGTKIPLKIILVENRQEWQFFKTLGVTLSASTTEIQLVLSSQFTVGAPVWSAKDKLYLRMALVFFTDFYMHLIFPPMESEAIAG